MAYSEACQTSKMESFARIAVRKKSILAENLQFFDDFMGRENAEIY